MDNTSNRNKVQNVLNYGCTVSKVYYSLLFLNKKKVSSKTLSEARKLGDKVNDLTDLVKQCLDRSAICPCSNECLFVDSYSEGKPIMAKAYQSCKKTSAIVFNLMLKDGFINELGHRGGMPWPKDNSISSQLAVLDNPEVQYTYNASEKEANEKGSDFSTNKTDIDIAFENILKDLAKKENGKKKDELANENENEEPPPH